MKLQDKSRRTGEKKHHLETRLPILMKNTASLPAVQMNNQPRIFTGSWDSQMKGTYIRSIHGKLKK